MRSRLLMAALVLALCLAFGIASMAFAEPEATQTNPGANILPGQKQRGWLGKFLWGYLARGDLRKGPNPIAVLAYIAGKTNTPIETLKTELKEGKTLQEICQAHGVEWAEVQNLLGQGNHSKEKAAAGLEKRVARLTEAKAKLEEAIQKATERIAGAESKLGNITNETLRGFAQRHLDIAKQKLASGQERLRILELEIQLAQDELAYVKSR